MNVQELISVLKEMPPDANVTHLWDGELRTNIEFVWLAKNNNVVTADFAEACYSDGARPVSAPSREECKRWCTPENLCLRRIL